VIIEIFDINQALVSLIVRLHMMSTLNSLPTFAALQIGDKYRITTPVNWKKGDDVIVHPAVTNEEAKTLFPEHKQHLVSYRILTLVNDALMSIRAALLEDHTPQG